VRRCLIIGVSALALTLSACGDKKEPEAQATSTSSTSTTTTPVGIPPAIAFTPVAKFQTPTAMAQRTGDDAFYVTEKQGRVVVLRDGVVRGPVLDLQGEVSTDGERGLLGIAFAPSSHLFYVHYTDKTGAIRVSEFALGENDAVNMHTRRDLLSVPHPRSNHNGGQLAFGPDNHLYIGLGDGGGSGDPDKNAQNLTSLLGKILRINPAANGSQPYTIPYDNPFLDQRGARGEIWAYGLRNPWRFSFDKEKQGIWIADVGQNKYEEINHIEKDAKGGQNYGWPLREGKNRFTGDKPTDAVDPVYEYSHENNACSVTGGFVYRGKAIDGLTGRYIFGDYCNGLLSTLTQKGTQWNPDPLPLPSGAQATFAGLISFGQDHNGELYVLGADGQLARLDAA
jgi:glucose/arabinose dehydrogenase